MNKYISSILGILLLSGCTTTSTPSDDYYQQKALETGDMYWCGFVDTDTTRCAFNAIYHKALRAQEPTHCQTLPETDLQQSCRESVLLHTAASTQNPALCTDITTPSLREQCEQYATFPVEETPNTTFSPSLSTILETKNSTLCTLVTEPERTFCLTQLQPSQE